MQTTIYYREEDQYIIDKLEEKSSRERKSNSACLLSIIEEYFEAENRIGEILTDMGALTEDKLEEGLRKQDEKETEKKKIGEILVEEDYVGEVDLDRALRVQTKPIE